MKRWYNLKFSNVLKTVKGTGVELERFSQESSNYNSEMISKFRFDNVDKDNYISWKSTFKNRSKKKHIYAHKFSSFLVSGTFLDFLADYKTSPFFKYPIKYVNRGDTYSDMFCIFFYSTLANHIDYSNSTWRINTERVNRNFAGLNKTYSIVEKNENVNSNLMIVKFNSISDHRKYFQITSKKENQLYSNCDLLDVEFKEFNVDDYDVIQIGLGCNSVLVSEWLATQITLNDFGDANFTLSKLNLK